MAVIEETKKGDWAIWERNARYVARFPTKAEAEAYRAKHYYPSAVAAYVQPQPRLNKLEAHAFAQWTGEKVLPGLGVATEGLIKKGYLTAEPCEGGYLVRPA
jgi:hypothetical protein